jgi:hypothetical protein
MTRSSDAVLKLFSDQERTATTIKLKNPKKVGKNHQTWKQRADQLEQQGTYMRA